MGWFDEQIKKRIQGDDDQFEAAFAHMADIIMDASDFEKAIDTDMLATERILRYYHVPSAAVPDDITDFYERLEYQFRPHGIMRRTVKLKKGWYKEAIGAMLMVNKENKLVALLPSVTAGYTYTDDKGRQRKVNASVADKLSDMAVCFYKPLPQKALAVPDLMKFIFSNVGVSDIVLIAFSTLVTTLIGLLSPYINKLLFGVVIPSGSLDLIAPVAVLFLGVTISTLVVRIFSNMITQRLNTKMSVAISAAAMMRLLSLPAGFFKQYSNGELMSRFSSLTGVCSSLSSVIFTMGFSSLFSLIYVGQIFSFAPSLVVPALLIILATVAFSVISVFVQMKISKKQMELSAKENGAVFSLISGVQKVKLTGSEKRAFSNWANIYSESAKLQFCPPWYIRANTVIGSAIGLFGTLVIYGVAGASGVSVADYMAFNASYGMVMGAFMAVSSIFSTIASIKPSLEMAKPLLQEIPETSSGKKVITKLMGSVELSNVSFRYNEDMPYVLRNLTLKIRSGQYIAVVGQTGCGKSTLIRLLLGFEKPEKGAVYFDGMDVQTVDTKSLRQKIGTVMQDGKLFTGDIFSNITICAPGANMDDAWWAAKIAGIEDDIKKMPMGMHTNISEGSGGVSGGQRQRLMIARAVAPKPKILIFDEATSALDNITQKMVSDALDTLKCTRIVVAHRLSTIRHCDRIIVMDGGCIAEDGTFEELMKKKGMFYELAKRQIAEET